ncbi:hypothetical protein OC842_007195 [Tilletia horrida]|uniref:Alpha-ketoglutarate-dependent dioxygenase AlkB-like domain-containing protein n=1 Tax=Tilletia horrida TaxID=155126 RepID=A0AAN6G4E3_9BASI|nr:hypothetical protein OC842_007195 [Tilletia horrida]
MASPPPTDATSSSPSSSSAAAKSANPPTLLAQARLREVGAGKDDNDGAAADREGGFFYLPNFITEQEEEYLLKQIYDAPALKWKTLQNRSGRTLGRLQTWGGQLAGSGGNTLIPQPLPGFMTSFPDLIKRLADTGAFQGSKHGQANHCLVNEYLAGQGIMPHEDGGAYYPAVATISLGSHTLLDIYRYASEPVSTALSTQEQGTEQEAGQGQGQGQGQAKEAPAARAREKDPAFSILQERRSLLITLGSAYRRFLHGIAERSADEPAHLKTAINVDRLGDAELRARVVRLIQSSPGEGPLSSTASEPAKGDAAGKRENEKVSADADSASAAAAAAATGLERGTRVSLTFRDVQRASPGLQSLLGRGGGKR